MSELRRSRVRRAPAWRGGLLAATLVVALLATPTGSSYEVGSASPTAITKHDVVKVSAATKRSPRARRGRSRVGFSPGASILDLGPQALRRDLRGMRRVGARRIRVDISWARTEWRRGSYNWGATDRVIKAARREGLKVLAILSYEPGWAQRWDVAGRRQPVNPTAFAHFADVAGRRYAPLVDAWEIWNEPNLESYWPSGPDPSAYAALVDAVAPVISKRDPRASILAGALAPADNASDGSQLSPMTFLAGYYAAAKNKGAVDAISVHPYSYPAMPAGCEAWNTFHRLKSVRAVMLANGQARQSIWLTEYGAPTGRHARAVSAKRQGNMLAQGYRRAKALGYVGPIFFYAYRDERANLGDLEANFGVVRHNGKRKASYYSLSRALRSPKRRR